VHLARRENVNVVRQIPFLRDEADRRLVAGRVNTALPADVWSHFSELERAELLGRSVGVTIRVFRKCFDPSQRSQYLVCALKWLVRRRTQGGRIVLLDPDTGLERAKLTPAHIAREEVSAFWRELAPGDWLVLYQHAGRNGTWRSERRRAFSSCCDRVAAEAFSAPGVANDVMLYAARRE